VTSTTQQTIAEEFKIIRDKLFPGLDIDYTALWQYKSRLVAGVEDTL